MFRKDATDSPCARLRWVGGTTTLAHANGLRLGSIGPARISHQDAEHKVAKYLSLTSCGALFGVFRVHTVLGAPWLVFSASARTCSLDRSSGYALRSRARAEAENPAPRSRPLVRNAGSYFGDDRKKGNKKRIFNRHMSVCQVFFMMNFANRYFSPGAGSQAWVNRARRS